MAEKVNQGVQNIHNSESILSKRQWDQNILWKFIISPEIPDEGKCAAVCCVVTFEEGLLVVKNKRGWELPAGHREKMKI